MNRFQVVRVESDSSEHQGLLIDAVEPLVIKLRHSHAANDVMAWRHWLRGPHLSLAFLIDDAAQARDAVACALASLRTWRAAHPARSLDEAGHLASSAALARTEGDPRNIAPIFPRDAVTLVPYDRPHPAGIAALAEARDRFQARILDCAFDLAAVRTRDRTEFMLTLACMIASVGSVRQDDSFDFWPTSVTAHAHGWFRATHPKANVAVERIAGSMCGPLGEVLDRFALMGRKYGDGERSPLLDAWMSAIADLERDLRGVVGVHRDSLRAATQASLVDASGSNGHDDYTLTHPSRRPWRDAAIGSSLHLRFRLLINLIYGVMPLFGVGPAERACLCHALHMTCVDRFPEFWRTAEHSGRALAERAFHGDIE